MTFHHLRLNLSKTKLIYLTARSSPPPKDSLSSLTASIYSHLRPQRIWENATSDRNLVFMKTIYKKTCAYTTSGNPVLHYQFLSLCTYWGLFLLSLFCSPVLVLFYSHHSMLIFPNHTTKPFYLILNLPFKVLQFLVLCPFIYRKTFKTIMHIHWLGNCGKYYLWLEPCVWL